MITLKPNPTIPGGATSPQRSPHPVRKYIDRVLSEDQEEYPSWDLTQPLPILPVPELRSSLDKYLQSIKPIVSEAQYEGTRVLVEEFGRPGGTGEKLQEKLIEYSKTVDNWVYSFWQDDMYMKNRLPLPVNSNPAMTFPRQKFEDQDAQLRFAAKFISGILDYKLIIDCHGLPIDRARHTEKGQPLCMDQYYRLFNSCRVPEIPKDLFVDTTPMTEIAEESRNIIVACNNHMFVLNVVLNYSRLSDDNLFTQLKRIVKMAEQSDCVEPVGILTAGERDRWAVARQILLQDPQNKASIEEIDRSLFLLCLDKAVPSTDGRDDASVAMQILHGQGSQLNTANRWFDKTMQFVIGPDGANGVCNEHSASEGIAVVQLNEHLLKYMVEREKRLPRMQSLCDLPYPRKLEWNISKEISKIIAEVCVEVDRLIEDMHLHILRFTGYGTKFPKSHNMSPDAFLQLSLQLTYYRVYGRLVSTYESASLRRFRGGRVDNIRACSSEALEWAKSMVGEITATNAEKIELMRKAIKKQTEILLQTILGNGFDNHFIGLREIALLYNYELPEMFKDQSYKQANQFILSTSQVPTTLDTLMCYGPVLPNGYGVCYNPRIDHMSFFISTFKSSEETNAEKFAATLEDSLMMIKDLLEEGRREENARKAFINGIS